MQATMTPRQTHASNLEYIRNMSGENYYRRMTFQEAEDWIQNYEYYLDEGYPSALASQYAWDHYFAPRTRSLK